MLKKTIKYVDFDGNEVTEVHYFNLSKSEMIEMEVSEKGGFAEMLQKIINTNDHKALIAEFKKIILMSYGERSEDGKRFIKNEQVREAFTQTLAYDALFMELATQADSAAKFVEGIIPQDMVLELGKQMRESVTPVLPPPPPAA